MSKCYIVTLPDGREIRMQADQPPTREVAEALADLLEAAHKKMEAEKGVIPVHRRDPRTDEAPAR